MKVIAPAERTSRRSSRMSRRQAGIGCGSRAVVGVRVESRGRLEMMMRDGAERDVTLITSSPSAVVS
jgi:hypothetical protein